MDGCWSSLAASALFISDRLHNIVTTEVVPCDMRELLSHACHMPREYSWRPMEWQQEVFHMAAGASGSGDHGWTGAQLAAAEC